MSLGDNVASVSLGSREGVGVAGVVGVGETAVSVGGSGVAVGSDSSLPQLIMVKIKRLNKISLNSCFADIVPLTMAFEDRQANGKAIPIMKLVTIGL